MRASQVFLQRTHQRSLYNITPINNVSSIIQNGILCFDDIKNVQHQSIAMNEVQARRDHIVIPGGLRLHQYANLYFTYNNAMLFKRKEIAENLCVLALSPEVLDMADCIVSDRNAAASLAKFYPAGDGLSQLDFDLIFSQYWTHDDPYEQSNHRAIKCAEILVPHQIPYSYVVGAYVVSESAEQMLRQTGFDQRIVINTKVFYRQGR